MHPRIYFIPLLILLSLASHAQSLSVSGTVQASGEAITGATISIEPAGRKTISNDNGYFHFSRLSAGTYTLTVSFTGMTGWTQTIVLAQKNAVLKITLEQRDTAVLEEVVVKDLKSTTVSGKLRDVSGTAIYAGKKTEVINLRNINANLATNNTRQIYARIPGLNIWEYDRGGLQLGIGGRGLSPNRSSNFNIRQDGYDISADALGYPESYYTPSTEALEKIEIIRGAASLQYGPQFGGLVNFVMKEGPKEKPFELTTRQTFGSYGFFNSFNSLGGTVAAGKLNYYAFYQYKKGDDWRPNSHYDQHNAYVHLGYKLTRRLTLSGEYTFMKYLAQQPGGLTDAQFREDPSVSVRARNWFQVDWNLINLNLDYAISDNTRINWRNYTLQGGRDALGVLSYINRPDNGGKRDLMTDKYSNFGSELRFIHQYRMFGDNKNTFLFGARLYRGLTNRKQGDGNDGSGPDFSFDGGQPNKSSYEFPGNNFAAFAENIFRISKKLSITPGIRFEHINTKGEGYYYKDNLFIDDEKMNEKMENPRSFVLLGVGASYKASKSTEFYANISQNYRSINFNDIRVVNTNSKVDPNLKDESGYNIELGFRGNIGNWLYTDVSLFYLRYNDRIGSIFVRDTSFMTYRLRTNVADSRNLGLEFLLEGDLMKAFQGNAARYKLVAYTNLSLIDARYIHTENTAIKNKLVENVPPVLFRTGVTAGNSKWNLTYQFSYQAKQYSDATNTEETPTAVDGAIPSFTVMDLSLSYNWRWFTVYSGINNLTDNKYFTRRADGYPGPGILPADRRNLYVTLQFKL
ncbi:TonB-dependent receptor [Flavihumibacter petaseus]|nr:TonB-dependent receptor [Flavihumibacter petaseus]